MIYRIILLFFGLSFSLMASERSTSYKCINLLENFTDVNFCIPKIDKGRDFLITGELGRVKELLEISQLIDRVTLSEISQNVYRIENLFGPFIESQFNHAAYFRGPNCYNTALIASGILPADQVIYVSPEEFEFYLKIYFEQVNNSDLLPGDLIVYDASASRGHVAFYLGAGLVFHKKGFLKNYLYRITGMYETSLVEEFEWRPSEYDTLAAPDFNWDNKSIAVYRKKEFVENNSINLDDKEMKALDLVSYISFHVLKNAPYWKVAKEMGIVTENLLTSLESEFSFLSKAPSEISRLAYFHLKSLSAQVFQSIEESHFSSPHTRVSDVNEEYCYIENEYFSELVEKLLVIFDETGKSTKKLVLKELKKYDRQKCKINLIDQIKN